MPRGHLGGFFGQFLGACRRKLRRHNTLKTPPPTPLGGRSRTAHGQITTPSLDTVLGGVRVHAGGIRRSSTPNGSLPRLRESDFPRIDSNSNSG